MEYTWLWASVRFAPWISLVIVAGFEKRMGTKVDLAVATIAVWAEVSAKPACLKVFAGTGVTRTFEFWGKASEALFGLRV